MIVRSCVVRREDMMPYTKKDETKQFLVICYSLLKDIFLIAY